MDTKQQIILIGGGDFFKTKNEFLKFLKTREVSVDNFIQKHDWKNNLQKDLGPTFQVLFPRMPNKDNADYVEWSIWFERLFPYVIENSIIIGHSLGGIFLVKYLSSKKFPKKIKRLILVSAPFFDIKQGNNNFNIPQDFGLLEEQSKDILLFHSENDTVVPIENVYKYGKKLKKAKINIVKNRGHFNQESFPEIIPFCH